MSSTPLAIIIGVGPGLGASLCRRFSRGGYTVACLSRNLPYLTTLATSITASTGHPAIPVQCDVTSEESITQALTPLLIKRDTGDNIVPVDVLIYNTGPQFRPGSFLNATRQDFVNGFNAGPLGAISAAQAVLPGMVNRGKGTILFTGATAAMKGGAGFGVLATAKFAMRALSQSLAREFGSKGIHVAHVIVDGLILSERTRQYRSDASEDTFLHPDDMAEVFWNLHQQPRTVWTQELDMRPFTEKF